MLALAFTCGAAQEVTLTFTGSDNYNHHCQLNRIIATNVTKGWSDTLYWPDTTLTFQSGTGITDFASSGTFGLSQNSPNPFNGTTQTSLMVEESGVVNLQIVDVTGRLVDTKSLSLQPGNHQFRIQLAHAGIYFLSAQQNGRISSIKMVNNSGEKNSIEYVGETAFAAKGLRGVSTQPFSLGDQMEYVGYATINQTEYESELIAQPQLGSETLPLIFDVLPFCAGNDSAIFIPDGTSCTADGVYLPIIFTSFPPQARIRDASDILSVRLNIEHPAVGELDIALVCPNGIYASLTSDQCTDHNGDPLAHFGAPNGNDGSYCDPEDNPQGTGWNYCWSENSSYAQNSGYCDLSSNIGHNAAETIDSSRLAQGVFGEPNFVPGEQYYTPCMSFESFLGCPVNGVWYIRVKDKYSGNNGYLYSWELMMDPNMIKGTTPKSQQ